MSITTCEKFKGEIENYLSNGQNNFESKIDSAFSSLKFKTWLCKTNIIKKDIQPIPTGTATQVIAVVRGA